MKKPVGVEICLKSRSRFSRPGLSYSINLSALSTAPLLRASCILTDRPTISLPLVPIILSSCFQCAHEGTDSTDKAWILESTKALYGRENNATRRFVMKNMTRPLRHTSGDFDLGEGHQPSSLSKILHDQGVRHDLCQMRC